MLSSKRHPVGRLLPQSVYYFYAFSRLAENLEKNLIFSIPSGNIGNFTGGFIASKMGLPVKKFIIAVNENDEFPLFLESGTYSPLKPSRNCVSNAMNIGHPSNLARIVNFYNGQMDEEGVIVQEPDMEKLRELIFSVSISDEETLETMKDAYTKNNLILEPHGAVGYRALKAFLEICPECKKNTSVLLETAHPAKFFETVHDCIGIHPEVPESLRGLMEKEESYKVIDADYDEFKKLLLL